ncbi:MAG: T9SS type A sorting domain-containing protein, partial [Ignavibacteriaceae bacterium]
KGFCVGVGGTFLTTQSVNQPLSIITPNGGEVITAGTDYEILWNSMDITDVKIEFSDNNGQDWITVIDSLPSTGIYTWVVPTVLSDQCRIKITDYSDPDIFDTSDGVFTIESSKMLNILQPNGGEVIPGGQYYEVQWNSEDVEYVKLEYSINNGASWNSIIDSTQSVGIYEWQVPNIQTIQGRIKITDITEPLINDISDDPFRIDFSVGVGPEGQVLIYSLSQNYPNPFNPSSIITFTIPNQEFVTLKVYDMLGTEVAVLFSEELTAGYYTIEFKSNGLSSGTYIYRINAGEFTETRKMILLK